MKYQLSSVLRVFSFSLSLVIFLSTFVIGLPVSAEETAEDVANNLWDSVSSVIDKAPDTSGAVDSFNLSDFKDSLEKVEDTYTPEEPVTKESFWFNDLDCSKKYTWTEYWFANCCTYSTFSNYTTFTFLPRSPAINIKALSYIKIDENALDYRFSYSFLNDISEHHFYYGFIYDGKAYYRNLPLNSCSFIGAKFKSGSDSITINSTNFNFYVKEACFWSGSADSLLIQGVDKRLDSSLSDVDVETPSFSYPSVTYSDPDVIKRDDPFSAVQDPSYDDSLYTDKKFVFPRATYVASERNYPSFDIDDDDNYYYTSDIFLDSEVEGSSFVGFFNKGIVKYVSPNLSHERVKFPISLRGKGIRFCYKSMSYDSELKKNVLTDSDFSCVLRDSSGSIISQPKYFHFDSDIGILWVTLLYSDLGITEDLLSTYSEVYLDFSNLTTATTIFFDEFHFFDSVPMSEVITITNFEKYYQGGDMQFDDEAKWFDADSLLNFSKVGFDYIYDCKNIYGPSNNFFKFSEGYHKDFTNSSQPITAFESVGFVVNRSDSINFSSGDGLYVGFETENYLLNSSKAQLNKYGNPPTVACDFVDYFTKYLSSIYVTDSSGKTQVFKPGNPKYTCYFTSNGYKVLLQIHLSDITLNNIKSVSVNFSHQKKLDPLFGYFMIQMPTKFLFQKTAGTFNLWQFCCNVVSSITSLPIKIYDYFSDPNSTFLQKILGIPSSIFNTFKDTLHSLRLDPQTLAGDVWSFFKFVFDSIGTFLSNIWNGLKDFFTNLPSHILNIINNIKSIPQKIVQLGDFIITSIKNFFIPTTSQFNALVYNELDFMEKKGGVIYQVPYYTVNIFKSLSTSNIKSKLTFPSLSVPMGNKSYKISSSKSVTLFDGVDKRLVTAVKYLFNFILISMLLGYLYMRIKPFFKR